jgi:hypothetical protein
MMIRDLLRRIKASKHIWPLIAGLVFRALFHVWDHFEIGEISVGRWAASDPDQWEYIDSVESYLSGNGWNPDHRMPGYGVLYLLIRSWTDMGTARDLLTLLQMIVGVLATYVFARSIAHAAQRPQWFWPVYGALLFASYSALSDIVLVNESFTTSALMLHWAAYVRYRSSGRLGWLFASGAFIGLAAFLRPIYGPILAFVPILELLRTDRALIKRFKYIVLFALPFFIADGIWVVRNHRHYGGFHPLTNHGSWNPRYAKSTLYAVIEMVSTYGGHAYYWEPGSEVRWFGYEPAAGGGTPNAIPGVSPPPEYAYTSVCTHDSLVAFANAMRFARFGDPSGAQQDSIAADLLAKARRWREAYKRERPLQYHVLSRLRLLKHETVNSGSEVLFKRPSSELSKLELVYKVIQSGLYWWALVLGGLASFVFLARWRTQPVAALLGVMCIYSVVACPFIMRAAEIRYMIPVFPLLLGASLWFAMTVRERSLARSGRSSRAGGA